MELILNRLTKKYNTMTAVDQISLKLGVGVYGLLGANGAGKTTLMRMLCGILTPTKGEIKFDDIDVSREAYRDMLGYLPQDFGYYPEFTGREFLYYIAALKGIPRIRAKGKINELLELVSLSEVSSKKIKTYSGGMKQRLGIAQALLNNPKILILDEPTSGLDPKERIRFRNLISKLGRDRIILLSTHIVSDVEYIADKILMMKDGKILQSGALSELLQTIENKVWECMVDTKTAEALTKDFPIINIRQDNTFVYLRLVSIKKPLEGAVNATATLEDLYLYYFSGVNNHE